MSNLKITGFGRFIIFLLIVAPIAYFGMQYLEKNGVLDNLRETTETNEADRPKDEPNTDSQDRPSDILNDMETKSATDREEESLIEKQRREIEELKKQNEELQRQRESSSTTASIPPPTQTPPPPPRTSTNTSDNAPSIDDLIRKAENKTGRPSSSAPEPSLPSNKESLATWACSFQNVNGEIEFYQENGKLMSRTAYRGMDRIDIHELIQRNDRYYVQNSPTDEYYVVRSDGNLDAFDENGFQTTCSRSE